MQRKQKSKSKNRELAKASPPRAPPLPDLLAVGVTLRFITTGYGATRSVGVSYANLLDAWCVAATATTAYQLFDYVKVRRVTVRAVTNNAGGATAGAAATVEVSFPGLTSGYIGSGKRVSDSALGVSTAAMVSAAPGKDALCSKWQASSNAIAFVLRVYDYADGIIPGCLIDVELSYKNDPDVTPVGVSSPVAGAIPGNFYYRGIDGGAVGGTWARSAFGPRI